MHPLVIVSAVLAWLAAFYAGCRFGSSVEREFFRVILRGLTYLPDQAGRAGVLLLPSSNPHGPRWPLFLAFRFPVGFPHNETADAGISALKLLSQTCPPAALDRDPSEALIRLYTPAPPAK